MISHYATQGPGQHLLPGLEEATSDDNHLCSSVYSHSQTMTDLGSNTVENIRSEISAGEFLGYPLLLFFYFT